MKQRKAYCNEAVSLSRPGDHIKRNQLETWSLFFCYNRKPHTGMFIPDDLRES